MVTDTKINPLYKLPKLFIGFGFCSLGIAMMYQARDLGLGPWDVLHTGIMNYTPLTFGQVSQIMGLMVILIGLTLGISPGIGTVFNMLFVGLFIDMFNKILFTPQTFWGKILILELGVWILCVGIYYYLNCGLGAGPRDGLMLGLVKKTNLSIAIIKTTMELTVVILGYLLGGKVGIGTIIVALTMGYALQVVFKVVNYDSKTTVHRTLKEDFMKLRNTI